MRCRRTDEKFSKRPPIKISFFNGQPLALLSERFKTSIKMVRMTNNAHTNKNRYAREADGNLSTKSRMYSISLSLKNFLSSKFPLF